MKLSILIPTVVGRETEFERLTKYLRKQYTGDDVEILSLKDNKEISIGEKRNRLYNMAKGKFSVMIDDDDMVSEDYIPTILSVLNDTIDCVGYFENCLINGKQQRSVISLNCKGWMTNDPPINGTHYNRTPFFKVPIKTSICKMVGVRDMRFGEDHDFAMRIHKYLNKEHFIYREMYFYRADSLTVEQHNKRYGISN